MLKYEAFVNISKVYILMGSSQQMLAQDSNWLLDSLRFSDHSSHSQIKIPHFLFGMSEIKTTILRSSTTKLKERYLESLRLN